VIAAHSTTRRGLWDASVIAFSFVGAAVAVWLLPASIEIVTWNDAGPGRVALLAPLIRLWLPFGGAVAATAAALFARPHSSGQWSARARLVAPLSILWLWALPYAPWVPDRVPVLLVLAGPIRGLVAAIAVAGVLTAWVRSKGGRFSRPPLPGRRGVFAVSLGVYILLGLRSLATVRLEGDEPHYLVITHSLLVDRDLKIDNNHERRDYVEFIDGELRPDYLRRGKNGAIYSVHAPGLPVLLLPGYALAGPRGAVLVMCLLAAFGALAVFDVAMLLGGPAIALLTWASVSLTVPFLPHAWMLYPEIVCAVVVAWAVLWLAAPLPTRPWPWIARGAILAALPWLHTKFVVFLPVLVAVLVVRFRARRQDTAALLAPIVLSTAGWLVFFYVLYGTIDPQAPYANYSNQYVRFENIPRSLLGLLIDQKFGLLIYSPVYLLAAGGMWFLLRDRQHRALGAALTIVAVPYLISSGRFYMWWGGAGAPARFLVPVLPLLAPAIAVWLAKASGRLRLATSVNVLAISLSIAAIALLDPGRKVLFSPPHGTARIIDLVQGSAPLTAVLPTFTEQEWGTALTRAVPWVVAAVSAWCLASLAARTWQLRTIGMAIVEALTFIVVGGLLSQTPGATDRLESALRGRINLMQAYDPEHLRGFDYAARAKLDPPGLLRASALAIERSATSAARQGRVGGPLDLPPGIYEARVTFRGPSHRAADVLISTGNDYVLASSGPLVSNPVTVAFDLPLRSSVWVSLSDRSATESVDLVEVRPISIVSKSRRPIAYARVIEPFASHPGAYVAYVDDEIYPEGGVFWTKGRNRAEVLVAPAGAAELLITLFVGPAGGSAILTVARRTWEVALSPNEARQMSVSLPRDATLLSVQVQASQSFRPSVVDPKSADTRALGSQVRIGLR
jgi:hypothetical protein